MNAPIDTFAGLFNPTGTQRYTLPGTIALDSPDGIEFGVSSFTSSGDMLLNTNVPAPGPALATIFRQPGPSGGPAAPPDAHGDQRLHHDGDGSRDLGAGNAAAQRGERHAG